MTGLRMLPMRAEPLRLRHVSDEDVDWLAGIVTRASDRFGTRVERGPGGMLVARFS